MKDAKPAAKAMLKGDVRYFRSEGYRVGGSAVTACQYDSDHVIICGYRITINGDRCVGDYVVKFTSSTRRRVGVDATSFDCP